ncbi:MAG: glycosyltransferase family 4 protein [Gemmatimonadota bacterium]
MLRVVFLTHNFPRFVGDVSGAFLATLAKGLVGRGVGVTVIAPSDGGDVGESELEGVAVRRVRYATPARESLAYRGTMAEAARSPRGALSAWSLGHAFRRAAREELQRGPAIVHAHWWIPAGLAAPPEAPLVVTVHGTDAVLLGKSLVARTLARPLFRRAKVVTAVSVSAADAIEASTGRVVAGTHIQPMPVEIGRYLTWSGGGAGIVSVARLTAQKRIDLALRAVALLPAELGPLTIIGDGPERGRLEALRDQLGLTARVRFLGAQSPAAVAELLGRADLALFPARKEGFGLAAAESLMVGVPVVACIDGGGVLAVVPETGAGRRAHPDPAAIAAAVLDLNADPAARDHARAEGIRWRSALSPEHVAEVCEGWYREALDV